MIFTLGHSTSTPEEFVSAATGIDAIVDVRSHPVSKHVPHFNQEAMEEWLPERGIDYEWWPELGGWSEKHIHLTDRFAAVGVDVAAYTKGAFPKQRIGKQVESVEGGPAWTNQGLYDYAWFTSLPEFLGVADVLIEEYAVRNCALICSEAMWWKCHRSMIADYLTFRGIWCAHLPSKRGKSGKRFTIHKDVLGNRLDRYPLTVLNAWIESARSKTAA